MLRCTRCKEEFLPLHAYGSDGDTDNPAPTQPTSTPTSESEQAEEDTLSEPDTGRQDVQDEDSAAQVPAAVAAQEAVRPRRAARLGLVQEPGLPPRKERTPAWCTLMQQGKRPCRGFCPITCRMKCRQQLNFERIHEIHSQFWAITSYDARRQFAYSLIVKVRFGVEGKRNVYEYYLPEISNSRIRVCKTLFCRVFGYSDRAYFVYCMMEGTPADSLVVKTDTRGTAPDHKNIDKVPIRSHILSYTGRISHYRRAHAPRMRYVPSELTFSDMYRDYQRTESYRQQSCSYEIYRLQCRHLHISTAKLGNEVCEYCLLTTGAEGNSC